MDAATDAEVDAPNATTRTGERHDVAIVGGGVAGLTAGIYTARAGLGTLILDAQHGSILRRNAHLENVPGFPAGVNAQRFLDMTHEQARRAGCSVRAGTVTGIEQESQGFALTVERATEGDDIEGESGGANRTVRAERVIAASWSEAGYLEGLDIDIEERGSKRFVPDTNDGPAAGRTGCNGLYVAGRLAGQYHQAVVAAGHGAQVAITLLHDAEVPLYHDWIAPKGYFTDRGREVPPGIEEIDEDERGRRERESMALMREYFAEPYPDEPVAHPSLADE